MNNFLSEATKLVLVMICFVLSFALLIIVAANARDHDVVVAVLALFSSISMLIVGFYFGQKGLPIPGAVNSQVTTTTSSTVVPTTTSIKVETPPTE